MPEGEIVGRTPNGPATIESLQEDLSALGVEPGMVLLVHSSLSSLGWVSGGAVSVILALEGVLGPQGTLVMPAHSTDLSDPVKWENPPVPEAWWNVIRQTMPAYDHDLTPTRGLGVIPETFRKQKGVVRSDHPQMSFAAWGLEAFTVVEGHALDYGLGESSPLARVYDLGGWVLLLGVGHESNTSLHLAEYRASYPGRREVRNGGPAVVDGVREWVTMRDIDLDTSDFQEIGEGFGIAGGPVRAGKVAQAGALLMHQPALVDYAVWWMEKNRTAQASEGLDEGNSL